MHHYAKRFAQNRQHRATSVAADTCVFASPSEARGARVRAVSGGLQRRSVNVRVARYGVARARSASVRRYATASVMSRAAPLAASVATCCSPSASMRAASVAAVSRRSQAGPRPFRCHRVGFADEHGRGLEIPEPAQRDTSRVEGRKHGGETTELEVLFGGVDAGAEGCSPFTAPARDHSFVVVRGRDGHVVTDPGADLDGLVAEGERAFGVLDREQHREPREAQRERSVDTGGAGDAHRFVSRRGRGVERRWWPRARS